MDHIFRSEVPEFIYYTESEGTVVASKKKKLSRPLFETIALVLNT